MPPLRERKEDVAALANFFIRRFSGELKKKIDGLESEALKLPMRYHWPGNIRELRKRHRTSYAARRGPQIAVGDLRLGDTGSFSSPREAASIIKIPPTGIPLEDIERLAVVEALKMSNWVQKRRKELLSISPRVMNYKINVLGIEFRAPPRGAALRAGRQFTGGCVGLNKRPGCDDSRRGAVYAAPGAGKPYDNDGSGSRRPFSLRALVRLASGWALRAPREAVRHSRAYTAASSTAGRAPAAPESPSDRRPAAAGALQRNAAARAD